VPLQDAPLALIVAGPTASGKSEAALRLAEALGGTIINADSMQVYGELHVLTARPDAKDLTRAPHLLYGHVPAQERYSAGRFVAETSAAVRACAEEGRLPILCGGTGLYLKALTEGLSPIPDLPPDLLRALEARWAEDAAGLRRELLEADPVMARLEPADRQRHLRALGVRLFTGRPLSSWQAEPRQPPLPRTRFRPARLDPPRGELYARCDLRFEHMVEKGALDEVRRLLSLGLDGGLPVMKALGVPELAAYLRSEVELADASELAKRTTRRFAKRQSTWFSNQTAWPAFASGQALQDYLLAEAS
jgi:tRNA dimethylallyltransferase